MVVAVMAAGSCVTMTITAWLMVGCTADGTGKVDVEKQRKAQPMDTMYTEQKAMAVYAYQPERALQIIDSAEVVGNLSQPRADFLRMRIYSQTQKGEVMDSLLGGSRFEATRAIGERLLQNNAVKTDLGMQQNVLEALFCTARQQRDKENGLRWARQLVDVCHRQGAETEALRNEAEIGTILCFMGQKERGFAKLDSVIAILQPPPLTPLPQGDQLRKSLEGRGTPAELMMQTEAEATPRPLRGGVGGGVHRFNELDALIIASKRKMDVLANEDRYLETLPLAQRIIDRLDDYELHPEAYHDGTYREPIDSTDRADYIQFYRSQAQGRMTAAYAVLGQQQSMGEVYELIERTVREATAREHLSRYHALEQDALRRESESRSRLMTLVAVISVSALLIVLAFVGFVMFQRHSIVRKNRALTHLIEKQQATLQPRPTKADLSSEQLRQIEERIRTERLYQNPNLGRDDICQMFNIRRDVLNQLINEHSDAGSVSTLINSIRLQEVCRLLGTDPKMTVNAIAEQVGLTPRNLRRLFQDQYGITPTEYRRSSQG